jgi:hypothetical protein
LREAPDLTAEELNDFRRRWLETNT